MRLEGAEPQGSSGSKGTGAMPAQEQNQPQQRKERGLPHRHTDESRREGERKPVKSIERESVKLADDAHRDEEAGQEEQGPKRRSHAQAEEAERPGQRQGPRRVAHHENGAGIQASCVLDRRDSIAVIWVGVVDKLAAGSPIGDEVARPGQVADDRLNG